MRYGYQDLGQQAEGNTVVVRWRGSAADVMLLDPVNFRKYCEDKKLVFYDAGGRYGRPPARLTIPEDGRWYVVADLHGYSAHAKATVEVVAPNGAQEQEVDEEALIEVG
jgi:hypothetical protein